MDVVLLDRVTIDRNSILLTYFRLENRNRGFSAIHHVHNKYGSNLKTKDER